MSRMERNKKIHQELEKESRGNLFARKEIKKPTEQSQQAPRQQPSQQQNYQQQARPQQGQAQHYQQHPSQGQGRPTPTSGNYGGGNGNGGNFNNGNNGNNGGTRPPQQPPKQKKRKKKHPIIRTIVIILVALIAYSGISFALGQAAAKKDSSIPAQETQTFNGFKDSNGASNILLLGSDSRDGEMARADTVMVLQLNGPSHKPKLISFMRDSLVTIPGVGDTKLNAAYAYGGAELMRKTLSDNFGIECMYYAIVDFKSFEKVIDTLFPGGVQITAEKDMSQNIDAKIKKGPQKMNGHVLLQYARFRKDEEGDFGRVRRQQQVMSAVFSQIKNPLALAKLPYAAGKVLGYAGTNIPTSFLVKNGLSIMKGAGGIDRLSVPIKDSWQYGYDMNGGSVLVMEMSKEKAAIRKFLDE